MTVFVSGSFCDCLFQGHSVTACFRVRKDSSVTSALQFLFEGLEIVVHYCTCFRVRKDFSPLLCLFWGQERLQSIIVFISGQRRLQSIIVFVSGQTRLQSIIVFISGQTRLQSIIVPVSGSEKTSDRYCACFRVRKDFSVPASSSKHVAAASGINSTG